MTLQSGLLAEFETPEALLNAIRALKGRRLVKLDAFTPWPVKGLDEALLLPKSRVPLVTLLGGLAGAGVAYLIQWWTNAVDYRLIVGARPAHAVPAFVPIVFETTVLFAGFSALLSMLYFCGLPELWSPVLEADGIQSASLDRFWLGVDDADPNFQAEQLRADLLRFGALRVVPFGKAP